MATKGSTFIEWETLEHPEHNHGPDWFVSVSIIAFALAVGSVILENYMFAVLIIVGAAALLLHAARIPKKITVRIFEKGILLDSLLYPYNSLRGFDMKEHERKILVQTNKLFLPVITIHFENINPEDIKKFLVKNVKEKEIEESFWEKLLDYFGF